MRLKNFVADILMAIYLLSAVKISHAQLIRRRIERRIEERRKANESVGLSAANVTTHRAAGCRDTPNVGFSIHAFSSGLRGAIWYPVTAADENYQYASGMASALAPDAPVSECGHYPMVVFSHGYGGCSVQSAFFTETLARAGYIVVAPDHKDALCKVDQPREGRIERAEEPFRRPEKWDQNTYVNRRNDIREVISQMLTDRKFGPLIDRDHIGGAGHSLGGYAIAALAGAWPSWKEPRIKAVLLFSPYVEPFLKKDSLRHIDVPVMYQGGTRDFGITPSLKKPGGAYDATRAPKFFIELRDIGHLGWTNSICKESGSAQSCSLSSPAAQVINEYGIGFFNQYLSHGSKPIQGSSGLATYRSSP